MLKNAKYLAMLFLFSSCSLISISEEDIKRYEGMDPKIKPLSVDYSQYRDLFESIYPEKLTDADIVGIMVSIKIEYSSLNGNYWKNPDETWADKQGDCEDFCTLFLGILMQEGLYNGQTMIVVNPNEGSTFTYHTKIADRKRNIEYELTGGLLEISPLKTNKILKEYTYAEVMYQAYEHSRLDYIF